MEKCLALVVSSHNVRFSITTVIKIHVLLLSFILFGCAKPSYELINRATDGAHSYLWASFPVWKP